QLLPDRQGGDAGHHPYLAVVRGGERRLVRPDRLRPDQEHRVGPGAVAAQLLVHPLGQRRRVDPQRAGDSGGHPTTRQLTSMVPPGCWAATSRRADTASSTAAAGTRSCPCLWSGCSPCPLRCSPWSPWSRAPV